MNEGDLIEGIGFRGHRSRPLVPKFGPTKSNRLGSSTNDFWKGQAEHLH